MDPFNHNPRMLARISALIVWALVAATAVFWGLRLFVRAADAPAHAVPVAEASALRGDLSRMLGAAPALAALTTAAPDAGSRFRLLGVMAPKAAAAGASPSTHGVALIAVDGKPAKAYSVGARLDGEMVLQSVSLRTASIGRAQEASFMTLELPPLPPPSTGTLPLIGSPVPLVSPAPVTPMASTVLPEMQPPSPALPVPPVPRAPGLVSRPRDPGSLTQ